MVRLVQKKKLTAINLYTCSFRLFHNGEYNEWINKQISLSVPPKEVFLPGEELEFFFHTLDVIYNKLVEEGEIDPELFPASSVTSIKDLIRKQSFKMDSFYGVFENLSPEHKVFPRLPDRLKESILSGTVEKLVSIRLSPLDKVLFNALSLFIRNVMNMNCMGKTYHNDDFPLIPYSPTNRYAYEVSILLEFICKIHEMKDCCMGCHVDINQFLSKLDRGFLLYRLCERISSPEITLLLKEFLNIKIVETDDGIIPLHSSGLLYVGELSLTLIDFYFNEFDFHFRKHGCFYKRSCYDILIGVPTFSLENSSIDINKNKILNDIRESLSKINIPVETEDDGYFKYNILLEGESMQLFGGELKLQNNLFLFTGKKE